MSPSTRENFYLSIIKFKSLLILHLCINQKKGSLVRLAINGKNDYLNQVEKTCVYFLIKYNKGQESILAHEKLSC